MELVSIIVPVYNVEKYVTKAIESVIAQTFSNWELFLIDDGSTDNSGKICDIYQEKDNRIHTFHKKNGGVSSARNVGLSKMKGSYYFFLDADDYIEPNCIEVALDCMRIENADVVKVSFFHFSENNEAVHEEEPNWDSLVRLKDQNTDYSEKAYFASVVGKLFRNNKEIVFFKENIHYGEDYLFVIENLLQRETMFIVKEKLYNYLKRPGSAVNSTYSYRRFTEIKAFSIIEEHLKEYPIAYSRLQSHVAERLYFHRTQIWKFDMPLSEEDKEIEKQLFRSHVRVMLSSPFCVKQKLAYCVAAFAPSLLKRYLKKKEIRVR